MVERPQRDRVRELRKQLTRSLALADDIGLGIVAIHIATALDTLPPTYDGSDAGTTAPS